MPLQFRRGTDSDRSTITPDIGEPLFTTNTKRLFIGDGTTAGGLRIGLDSSEVLDIVNDNSVDSAIVENIIDSAYVRGKQDYAYSSLTGTPTALTEFTNDLTITTDSVGEGSTNLYYTDTRVSTLVDSAYINLRTDANLDSDLTIQLIDSAYVQARQTTADLTNYRTFTQIQSMIDSEVNAVIDAAPGALDTLNELAAALGDDANFSTTITNQIAALPDSAQVATIVTSYGYATEGYVDIAVDALPDSAQVATIVTSYGYATTGYVDNAVAALPDSSQVATIVTSYGYTTYDSANTLGLIDSAYITARTSNQTLDTTSDVEFNKVNSVLDGAIQFTAKNESGATLTKGTVVYISGVSGNTPLVDKADANDASKMPAFGIVAEDANNNSNVNVFTFGTLSGLDTSAFSAGDTLYVSTTAGELTNTAPAGSSSLLQNIGRVIRSDASAGSIKVGGAGRTNAVPNLDAGYIFYGNDSNRSAATDLSTIIDSAYVQVRQTSQDFAYSSLTGAPNVLDSADVVSLITANDQQRDSAFVTDIIDSAYITARAGAGTDSATVVSIAAAPKEYIDTTTYTVTVASKTSSNIYYNTGSSLGYFLDGIETPFIEFVSGQTYVFDQSDTSNANHAIRFYYDVDKTTSYTSGVTVAGTAGSSGASTTIVVDDDTPSRLYYQCENHDKMGWAIGVDNHNVTGLTTDDLTEGSTNRYFSNTLAQGAFTGGTGVSISSGTISIGQPVGTSDNVSFGNLTLSGNLTVQGSTTYVQTETLTVDDNIIELNSNVTGAPTEDGGIEINRGTSSNVSLIWDEDSDNWKLTTDGTNYYKILTSNDNIAATDATTLDGQAASYYLNYNNFTNTPTSILDFSITDGNAGQALITDGSGNFTFSTISGGGGGGASGATTTARHQNVSTGGAAYGTVGGTYSDVLVYVNGILARDSDDYSFNDSSGIVTFITAPETGSEIDIIGIKSNTLDIDSSDNVTFNGDIKVGNHSNYSSGTTTGSSIVETTIDTFDATTVRGAKYVITAENDSDRYQISEALVVHDGTTATITTYGTINTGTGNLCVFDANYDSVSNVVELNATPTTINTVYKVVRTDVVI